MKTLSTLITLSVICFTSTAMIASHDKSKPYLKGDYQRVSSLIKIGTQEPIAGGGRGANVEPEKQSFSLTKAEISRGRIYVARANFKDRTTSVISKGLKQPSQIEQINLALSFAGGERPLKWKIKDDKLYAVSLIEFAPGQYACNLVEVGLSSAFSTAKATTRYAIAADVVTVVRPLSDAFIEAVNRVGVTEARKDVRYDFIVEDNGQFDFFVLFDGQLRRWHYEERAKWKKTASATFNNSEDFLVIKDNGNLVMVTESGQHYLVEGADLAQIKDSESLSTKPDKNASYLVVDTDNHEHYFFSADKESRSVGTGNSILYSNRTLRQAALPSQVAEAINVVLAAPSK
jgi:hypothetical protein